MNVAAPSLDHERAQALFGQLVDEELAPADEIALRSHLDSCADCQHELERYSRTVSLVRSLEREKAPAELAAQVMKRVRRRRRGLFGLQGGRFFEQVSVPAEVAVPVVLVAIAAAAVIVLFFLQ
ncbi:MAG: anti-sigma factor family protein [Myxococcales bacterium]